MNYDSESVKMSVTAEIIYKIQDKYVKYSYHSANKSIESNICNINKLPFFPLVF